ncbi:MAG: hypothetical protein JW889_05515 [Verrucomicrobia bacterium]|nr:hypothetical protein [Verrucomicrobiota bacterium]
MKTVVFLGALVLCLGVGAAPAETIHNDQLGFTLRLPEGTRSFPQGMQGSDTLYSYSVGRLPQEGHLLVFKIERLGGILPRERYTLEQLLEHMKGSGAAAAIPPDAKISLIDEAWGGFDLQVMRMESTTQGVAMVAHTVQVPLLVEAIQISTYAGRQNAEEGRQLLRILLANLQGESNWSIRNLNSPATHRLTETESWSRMLKGIGQLLTVLVVVLLIVGAVFRRSRG